MSESAKFVSVDVSIDVELITSMVHNVEVPEFFYYDECPLHVKMVDVNGEQKFRIWLWERFFNGIFMVSGNLYFIPVYPEECKTGMVSPLPKGVQILRHLGVLNLGYTRGRKGDTYDSIHMLLVRVEG